MNQKNPKKKNSQAKKTKEYEEAEGGNKKKTHTRTHKAC